jgi:flagellar biosynthesis protein FlhF
VTDWIAKIKNAGRRKPDKLETVAADIRARLTTAPELGRPHCARKVIALVGPPGAGKTTTTVKLAVKYGLTAQKPMHIVSMDGYRVAGADALRTYAGGMGIGFDALETAGSLAQTLEEHSGKGLVLIDTPGLGPGDLKGAAPLASFLSKNREIDVHLVLPATMSLADMTATFERFRSCLPEKLIFTGLDMTCSVAPLLSLAMETEKPISFLGVGQQIPEDLEEADVERLIRRAMPEARKSATSAA